MPAIFISHSSRDDVLASAVAGWLRTRGFDDFFIDHETQRAGDKWTENLRHAKASCRVVICVVTRNWLESDECYGEFLAAWYMGRRMIPLLAQVTKAELNAKQTSRLSRVLLEDYGVNIDAAMAETPFNLDPHPSITETLVSGLRAAGALSEVGLDPYAFEMDRLARPDPFPGLASFSDTDADAAIFFGRSQEIARCLEDLRELRATGDRRAYVILGASGSGKSSLMKAGILPRIRRERGWFAIKTFRPGSDPLSSFADAISRTAAELSLSLSVGAVRDNLEAALRTKDDVRATVSEILHPLKQHANRNGATTLVSLDQGEELRGSSEGAALLGKLMRALLSDVREGDPSPYSLMLTFRSDSFREFETSSIFEGIETRVQNIRALRTHRFSATIEQPAARYGVEIEPQLVDALVEDAEGDDALPLLALALERLWHQRHSEGRLLRAHYDAMGKLTGLIEDSAERAFCGAQPLGAANAPLPKPSPALNDQAAHIFIPSLAQLNERGGVVRRVANLSEFNSDGRALLENFAAWRLVIISGDSVEVAHEAVFREWPRLRGWLKEEQSRLETMRALESAARAWEAGGRNAEELTHRGKRLTQAAALLHIPEYRSQIDRNEGTANYLAASLDARQMSRLKYAAIGVGGVLIALTLSFTPTILNQMARAAEAHKHEAAVHAANAYLAHSQVLTRSNDAGSLPPRSVFRDCDDCPEMVVIASGQFLMGSPTQELQRGLDESPQHAVRVPRFAIGRFTITFEEWDKCVAAGGCPPVIPPTDYHSGRGRHPVIAVSWRDAHAYTHWLSQRTHQHYRLPSEAEWEYAARANTQTPYYTGPTITHAQANFDAFINEVEPVGVYPPNQFGLFDMAGNVWQWVEDCYNISYNGAPLDGSPWTSGECMQHVIRGGSWYNDAATVRSALRHVASLSSKPAHGGFRIVREIRSR